ncbi:hypothetical protein EV44_g3156 [Erysiphe necator]|uniref:Uncharacterized protein n=1 Tax=Uncinula necator TaxID=52586 RepID=A0A0B1P1J7_UNCNE|nr:hypothetical protein EV44_g3156 [Erysiphe necator]
MLTACNKAKRPVRRKDNNYVSNNGKDVAEWNRTCETEKNQGRQKQAGKIAAYQEWANSWAGQNNTQNSCHTAPADPGSWQAVKIITDERTGRKRLSKKDTPFNIHLNLKRAQSSIAIQIRSEYLGLNSYLHRRRVPGVENPKCQCGYPSQNAKHMILACPQWAKGRGEVLRRAKDRSYKAMMNSSEDVARITQRILHEGWIKQFRLVREVEAVQKKKENVKSRKGLGWITHWTHSVNALPKGKIET